MSYPCAATALKIVVETWHSPPPMTFSSERLLMIAPAYAYPRSTVTGPSSSQKEKVCPGRMTTPSNFDAPVEMFAWPDALGGYYVVNVDVRTRFGRNAFACSVVNSEASTTSAASRALVAPVTAR